MARKWVATDFGGLNVLKEIEVEVPAPKSGEVTIEVRAVGMNPIDYKLVAFGQDRSLLPLSIGFEVAGIISAIGPDTEIASGKAKVGDAVLAFRISGGYATALTVPAKDVFAKPENISFEQAANLLLVGATAADMLNLAKVKEGDTIVVHGASGAVGVSVLQQARLLGLKAIGTASEKNFEIVKKFGGIPVQYGAGLKERIEAAAPAKAGITAALDTVGTDEAIDVSLALVPDRQRIVSAAAFGRSQKDGFQAVGGGNPDSAAFRDKVRAHLIELAAGGKLEVPIGKTFSFEEAKAALELLISQHPGGKLALLVND